MGYYDRPQSLKKIENEIKVVEYFESNGGTIQQISDALNMKRSTVQRYLNSVSDPVQLKKIKEYLKRNQEIGKSKGGKNSGYSKDEFGRFTGSSKRK